MSEREDRLRSLLDRVRAKRPDERTPHAADALDRIRTASGTMTAASDPAIPARPASPQPTPPPSEPPMRAPSSPLPEPAAAVESPTRYSSQPPTVERPLSVEPRARSGRPSAGAPPASATPAHPESIRPQSVAPSGQPVVYSTEQPEFVRPRTFGDLLELTLSLRPR